MKWLLFIILGWSFAEATWGWTYHYSNNTMTWYKARKWCQEHFTDMVVIQNQTENDYIVSILPNRTNSPYYWIGLTKEHINETWKWVGNNSTWVGEHSWAENEPNNNHITEFCVEIYINSGQNRGKWNDEKCAKNKSPVCYKAQCNDSSCVKGSCWETLNSTACLCSDGYEGDKCQTVVDCPPLSQPENGDLKCSQGGWEFNTTCSFKCDPGFAINGSYMVTCKANRTWSDLQSVCSAVQCPPLPQPSNGNFSCSKEGQIFNSTCHFKCHLGFFMIGSSAVTCAANGHWTGPRPVCTSYKQALLAVAGCGALCSFFCICFCCIRHRKKKKRAQDRLVLHREPEDATSPPSDVNGGTSGNTLTP
ncbi:L-selectin isoform X1 [Xiphophorus couchianus]|uniref:L-selectin isoform X1 n=1 Tax=Xiphophorus couchianus TaxID=32473 RepID=UPI0010163570|nr:L-selectin isoform X1 [Xiphophorus couchianus]XP_027882455.1 L-selectin isoform X1 [Xiphophorus couchianus]